MLFFAAIRDLGGGYFQNRKLGYRANFQLAIPGFRCQMFRIIDDGGIPLVHIFPKDTGQRVGDI